MHQFILMALAKFDQSWKYESLQIVGDLTIIKNKSRQKLRLKTFVEAAS